jgi:DNA-binding MarR family transcriptional regulator
VTQPSEPLVAAGDDVGLLCHVVSTATNAHILRELSAAGYADVRISHGYIFQGLLAGDTTVTQLAARLGVSAQAVSKTVSELEDARYVERRRSADDGRARVIVISRRGHNMLAASRRARREVAEQIGAALGDRDLDRLTMLLRRVSEVFGGLEAISGRRIQPVEEL